MAKPKFHRPRYCNPLILQVLCMDSMLADWVRANQFEGFGLQGSGCGQDGDGGSVGVLTVAACFSMLGNAAVFSRLFIETGSLPFSPLTLREINEATMEPQQHYQALSLKSKQEVSPQ